MAKGNSVSDTVASLITPIAEDMGYFVWDVEFVKEGGRRILRITIDSEEGVGIDDCERLHRAIDPLLDEADPIEEAYYLEVSSPGIERDLRTELHFEACCGWDVEVRLYAPLNGSKMFRGELLPLGDGGEIRILCDGQTLEFARSAVAKVQTYFEF